MPIIRNQLSTGMYSLMMALMLKAHAMALLDAIEFAMGKSISDRNTEETVKRFGCSLEKDAS